LSYVLFRLFLSVLLGHVYSQRGAIVSLKNSRVIVFHTSLGQHVVSAGGNCVGNLLSCASSLACALLLTLGLGGSRKQASAPAAGSCACLESAHVTAL
jgi:hypothetical protein